jgi:hypothetical protein
LKGVLGIMMIADDAPTNAEDHRRVTMEEGFKGRGVFLLDEGSEQLPIGPAGVVQPQDGSAKPVDHGAYLWRRHVYPPWPVASDLTYYCPPRVRFMHFLCRGIEKLVGRLLDALWSKALGTICLLPTPNGGRARNERKHKRRRRFLPIPRPGVAGPGSPSYTVVSANLRLTAPPSARENDRMSIETAATDPPTDTEHSDTEAVLRHAFERTPLDAEVARRVDERADQITEQIRRTHGVIDDPTFQSLLVDEES